MHHDRLTIASLAVCCALAVGASYAQNTAGAPGLSPTAELQKNSPTPMSGVQNNASAQNQKANASSDSMQNQSAKKKKKHAENASGNDSGGSMTQPASGSTSS